MRECVAIRRLDQAYEVIGQMRLHEWGDDLRQSFRESVKGVLESSMRDRIDRYLEGLEAQGESDRRNGFYSRHLLTAVGDIELDIPRTRNFSARGIIRAYARRTGDVDRVIMASYVLGVSTRKMADTLEPILGERVSAATVSRVTQKLDAVVADFHKRPLAGRFRALMFDGVVLSRKTGAGAVRRPVLVALGILPNGKKVVIDFLLARSESAEEWEHFLRGLYKRGLDGAGVEVIGMDGGKGLWSAVRSVYPDIPIQRCWAHKVRNVLDKVRMADHEAVKKDLHRVMDARDVVRARKAASDFAKRWGGQYPNAVKCLRMDLDELLECYRFKDKEWRKAVRTTNAIERRFREVKRRTRPMGVFTDRTSMDRILYAVFSHENRNQGVSPLFLLTQNS